MKSFQSWGKNTRGCFLKKLTKSRRKSNKLYQLRIDFWRQNLELIGYQPLKTNRSLGSKRQEFIELKNVIEIQHFFFHKYASRRQSNNFIHGIFDQNNTWITDQSIIGQVLLFSIEPKMVCHLGDLPINHLSEDQFQSLNAPVSMDEIHAVVMNLAAWKTPIVDGFPPRFFPKQLGFHQR